MIIGMYAMEFISWTGLAVFSPIFYC